MRLDGAAADVLSRFERAGVRALLLKGPSIARWLYADDESRIYLDCDLLIAPEDTEAAEAALGSLAYTREFDDRRMPAWWREHASTWFDYDEGVTIDLHRTLPGIGVGPETAWRVLAADADVVVVAGYPAPTLAKPGRALHIALHAAQHGIAWLRPITDLERALSIADDDLWLRAAVLASKLKAIESFAAGLRLVPAGAELAQRLALPPNLSVDAQLRAASPPAVALGFEQLARADGMRARAEIVVRKFVPPPAFIRHWDPRARHSRTSLLLAYLRRPLWILRQSPPALRAWLRARRAVRGARRAEEG
jgi:hypothetical protein